MTPRMFAVVAYCVVGLGLAAQGLRYLLASQYMHYHADVVHESWSDLKKSEQRLVLGLLKGFGAGMFCLGLATMYIALEPLRHGHGQAHWFLVVLTVAYTGMLVHITRFALLPNAAPIEVTSTMFALSIVAAIASFL